MRDTELNNSMMSSIRVPRTAPIQVVRISILRKSPTLFTTSTIGLRQWNWDYNPIS